MNIHQQDLDIETEINLIMCVSWARFGLIQNEREKKWKTKEKGKEMEIGNMIFLTVWFERNTKKKI